MTSGGTWSTGTLSTSQYTMCPLTEAWILKVSDGIMYRQAYSNSPFRTPILQSNLLSMYSWTTIQSVSLRNLLATLMNSETVDAFSTLTEKDVEGSFKTKGVPSSSKRPLMHVSLTSFLLKNLVLGIEMFFFIR